MHADRIKVFHRADSNVVALAVAHDFELDLLPAGNALLDQNLVDRGLAQAAVADLTQLLLVMYNTAAAAAEGKGGTDDERIADLICKGDGRFNVLDDKRGNDRLADGFHRVLEHLAVFRFVNGLGIGAE